MGSTPNDAFVTELDEKLISCGLSPKQAKSYVDFYLEQLQQNGQKNTPNLRFPSDKCMETLAEAQRIISQSTIDKHLTRELDNYNIYRFLQTPCENWKSAKVAAVLCFCRSQEEVDDTFCSDEDWLFVTSDTVYLLADYLKSAFSDADLAWKIFQKAALLGAEKSKERITTVLDLLGEEIGRKAIYTDINDSGWLFYRFYTDPIGCIGYLKECGLTSEKVLNLIEHDSYILYMYKEGCRRKYNHDQERINFLIQKYMR